MVSLLGSSHLLVRVLACHGDTHLAMELLAPILDSDMRYLESKSECRCKLVKALQL